MAALTARMGFFRKKADPISERSRQLTARIAALESKIKQLNQQAEPPDPRRLRSTAYPPGSPAAARPARGAPAARQAEPVFERVDQQPLKDPPAPPATAGHYNEWGARKFDLMELLERIKRKFRGPPAANPQLVNYLAAGNIQGLRPLRYEKRVARNRFVALALLLVIVLFGLFCFLARRH
jgi:cell division protein FtsB